MMCRLHELTNRRSLASEADLRRHVHIFRFPDSTGAAQPIHQSLIEESSGYLHYQSQLGSSAKHSMYAPFASKVGWEVAERA